MFENVEIHCTSLAGSINYNRTETFAGYASEYEINRAFDRNGQIADALEASEFMNAILWSRSRLEGINDECARQVGAKDAADFRRKLNSVNLSLAGFAMFAVTTDPQGRVTDYASGALARGELGGNRIQFNRGVNWSAPQTTFGVDQNGVIVPLDLASFEAGRTGIGSLTGSQFIDLVFLHEMAHIFNKDHPHNDAGAFNFEIVFKCIR